MKILISGWFAFALMVYLLTPVRAQDKKQLQQNVERTFKTHEPDWLCEKSTPEGESTAESPKVFYNFQCKYKGQQLNQVSGSVYVLSSKQDAVKMLDRSQMMLQVNKSKPLYEIGEQAYWYAGHGSAWITFRNGTVFGQVNVGVVDSRTVADPSPQMIGQKRQHRKLPPASCSCLLQLPPASCKNSVTVPRVVKAQPWAKISQRFQR